MKKTEKNSFVLRLFIVATIFTGLTNNIAASQANLQAQHQIVQKTFTNDLNQNLSHTPTDPFLEMVSFISSPKPLQQTFQTTYKIEHIYPLPNSKFLVESVDALHLLADSRDEIACIAKPANFKKVMISPDKRFFAIAASDYRNTSFVYLYTTANLQPIGEPLEIEKPIQGFWKVWISPDSSYVISSDGYNLEYTSVQNPTSPQILKSKRELKDVIISPNGKFFIKLNKNGTAQIYAVDTSTCTLKRIGNPLSSIQTQIYMADPVKISNNSEFIVVFFKNNTAQIYSINTEAQSYAPVGNPIQNVYKGDVNTAIEISPNNAFILINHGGEHTNASFQVYDSKTGQPFNFVLDENHNIWRTKITPDSKFILEENNGLYVYSVDSAVQTITFKYSIDDIWRGSEEAIKCSNSGKFFAVLSQDGNIDLYETESGKQIGDSKPITKNAPDESICAYFLRNDEIIVIDNSDTMDVYSTTGFNLIDKLEVNGFIDNHAHSSFIVWKAELLEASNSSLDQNLPSSQHSSLSVPQATNPSLASPQTRIVHQNHVCSQSSSQSNCGICGTTMSQTNFAVTTPVTLGKRSINSLEHKENDSQQDKKMRGEEASLASTTQQATIMPPFQFLMPSTNPFTLQSTQQAQSSQAGTQSNTTNDIHMDHTTESHS